MPRPKDDFFWKYFKKTSEGSICNFCGKQFHGIPSISRIKYHIIGTNDRGVSVCEKIAVRDRQEARLHAEEEGANKRRKIEQPSKTGTEQEVGEGHFLYHDEQGNHAGSMRPPMEHRVFPELHKNGGIEMRLTVPVGWGFRENRDLLWSWLMDDDVLSIGIYGMGGVGKTELAKHINNKLLDTPNPFLHVYWVDVSWDASVIKLQDDIAEAVGLSFSSLDDENVRAARLCQTLMNNKRSVLILDNVWEDIDFQKIGIFPHTSACKLILTARSSDLCRRTGCQKVVRMEPLDDGEDWALFKETLGIEMKLDSQMEKIAKSVVEKCKGLPLGITAVGRSMRKAVDIPEWKCMLEELQRSRPRQDIMEVFETLQLSYNSLNDSRLQESFLSCALHDSHGAQFPRMECLKNLITDGIIEGMKSGRWELQKSHCILQKLENASLYDTADMQMHPLMRIMALRMIKKISERQIVEVSNEQIKELPIEEEWTTDLTKVILVNTAIKEITHGHTPSCPNLTVMLLCGNRNLVFIHDSFFHYLHGLQVLDLSCTALKKLPDSVSDLVNLTSLLLRECWLLRDVPSLQKLKSMRKLDMYGSGVENVAHGMGFLSNLNYLDLCGTQIQTMPGGILYNLSNLQFLGLDNLVKGEELARLTNLETLKCPFDGLCSFNTYMRILKTEVDKFLYIFGDAYQYELGKDGDEYDPMCDRSVILFCCHGGDEEEDDIYLPTNIQYFGMYYSSIGRSLCLESKSELKCLYMEDCDGMEYLTRDVGFENTFSNLRELLILNCMSIKNLFPACLLPNLRNLEQIHVKGCKLLEEIVASCPQQYSLATNAVIESSLPKLKLLELINLRQLKNICCKKLTCNSLQKLVVVDCPNLEDIPLSLPIQSLEKVHAYPEDWWQRVRWENPNSKALVPVTATKMTYESKLLD